MNLLFRAVKKNGSVQNSNYFLPFDSAASVDKLLDGVRGAAEVTAKDCLKVVFVLVSPSVRADVFSTVELNEDDTFR